MKEIEVGEYIRTNFGKIDKVKNNNYYMPQYIEGKRGLYLRDKIICHSIRISDLLKEDDILKIYTGVSYLLFYISKIKKEKLISGIIEINRNDIGNFIIVDGVFKGCKFSVLTKEQYESNCYKGINNMEEENKVTNSEKYINEMIRREEELGVLNTNNISDGCHTFGELYDHRAKLFSIICNQDFICENVWKSKLHNDGTMFDGYFIVGINTPKGQATYHYEMKYWDLFHIKELDKAPKWDGHTANEAIERLLSLC